MSGIHVAWSVIIAATQTGCTSEIRSTHTETVVHMCEAPPLQGPPRPSFVWLHSQLVEVEKAFYAKQNVKKRKTAKNKRKKRRR
jgi:hypothetical protein